MEKRIAVLALQGAFAEHEKMLGEMGISCFEVRQRRDWEQRKDGLVIPGGESTVQSKLLEDSGLMEPLRKDILGGMPVFGTCAGLILLARQMEGGPEHRLATMDISVKRNAYGRQLGSFRTRALFAGRTIPMTFIRAPYIEQAGDGVEILSEVDGRIVAACQNNQIVTAFHPELDDCKEVYDFFLSFL